ncbi:MAG: ABC transporter ATP-binding protein/permease [Bacillales bacterium]|jgi:ABC-type bacteriocin/lantibiotic exporter with double-glycine peptidase domain|nr:ABC transporter ATP-binding protein/permease [Bacillales bacterium]
MKKLINFLKFTQKRFSKKTKLRFLFIFLLTILINVIAILLPLIQKKIIDGLYINEANYESLFIYLFFGVLAAIVSIFEAIILNKVFFSFRRDLSIELLSSLTVKDNSIVETRGSGAFMVSVFGDTGRVSNIVATNYFAILLNIITAIVTIFISLLWTYYFLIIVVVSYLFMALTIWLTNKTYVKVYKKAREIIYEINPVVLEFIENRKSIIGFSNIQKQMQRIKVKFIERDKLTQKAFNANILGKTLITAIQSVSVVVFFVISMLQIINGNMEISAFLSLLSYFALVFVPLSAVQKLVENINNFDLVKAKIDECLDVPIILSFPKSNLLQIIDLTIKYNDRVILENISIEINENIGIVGLSGEGKTTLIKSIYGELISSSGKVELGLKQTHLLPKSLVYSIIPYYSQDLELYDNDLVYNICLGKEALTNELLLEKRNEYYQKFIELRNRILSCDTFSKIDLDFLYGLFRVDVLPKNSNVIKELIENIKEMDTNAILLVTNSYISRNYYSQELYCSLTEDFELTKIDNRNIGQRGTKISGGEKTRICLARFILSIGNYYVLDEPLTNVDLLLEDKMVKLLHKYLHNKKGIIVSHKMNLISELSDKICILNNNVIEDIGTHNQLIQRNTLYKTLYEKSKKI